MPSGGGPVEEVDMTPSEELVVAILSDIAIEGTQTPETGTRWPTVSPPPPSASQGNSVDFSQVGILI